MREKYKIFRGKIGLSVHLVVLTEGLIYNTLPRGGRILDGQGWAAPLNSRSFHLFSLFLSPLPRPMQSARFDQFMIYSRLESLHTKSPSKRKELSP